MPKKRSKNVALVLASGGAKGYAHIGAIETLISRGYNIKSVTGCSMGSLVGGMYAAGKLKETREIMLSVDFAKYFALLDFNILNWDGLLKGDKVVEQLRAIAPGSRIENLAIPFRAIATDITHDRETVFESGDLIDAIRASISMPGVFKPMRIGGTEYIDGGVMDPLPLSHAIRSEDDLLVAVDVNAHTAPQCARPASLISKMEMLSGSVDSLRDTIPPLGRSILDAVMSKAKGIAEKADKNASHAKSTITKILSEYTQLSIVSLTDMALRITPPDIHVAIPHNQFSTFDFANAANIIEEGSRRMEAALNTYERE